MTTRLLLALAAVATFAYAANPATPAPGETRHQAQTCFEDQPCWNCQTHGNRYCGAIGSEAQR